jgi:hypothetical protein
MQKEYRDPILYQTHYVVKKIAKYGKAFRVKVVVTTSPDGAKRWKEAEEKNSTDPTPATPPKFYTIPCKTREEDLATATRLRKKQTGRRKQTPENVAATRFDSSTLPPSALLLRCSAA